MARRKKGQKVDGWVILDKPVGITSTAAVGAVKRLFDAQKAGHGGTLDPLATGVLPIALGEATKTVPFIMDGEKTYRFTCKFGEAGQPSGTGTVLFGIASRAAAARRPMSTGNDRKSEAPPFIAATTCSVVGASATRITGTNVPLGNECRTSLSVSVPSSNSGATNRRGAPASRA